MKEKLKKIYLKLTTIILLLTSRISFADDNPFPSVDTGGKDILHATGSFMDTALKYITIGVGGFLIVVAIGVLYSRLREDSRDKEHGNMVMTMLMVAVVAVVGFVLIGIGWTAFNKAIT